MVEAGGVGRLRLTQNTQLIQNIEKAGTPKTAKWADLCV
jgi:hypothetical protein